MATAVFRRGDDLQMTNYTPGADIDAGDVVIVETRPYIALRPIVSGELGALVSWGGVWRVVAAGALDPGDKIFINASTGKLNLTAAATAGDKHFGYVELGSSAAGNNSEFDAMFMPDGSVATGP